MSLRQSRTTINGPKRFSLQIPDNFSKILFINDLPLINLPDSNKNVAADVILIAQIHQHTQTRFSTHRNFTQLWRLEYKYWKKNFISFQGKGFTLMTNKHKPTAYLYIPVVCNKSRDSGTLCKLRWEECCDVCEKESNKCTENKFGTCPVIPCRADCRSICDIWLSLEGLSSCGRLWLFRVFPHSKKRETFATTYRKKTTMTLALRGLSNRSIHSKCQKIISILFVLENIR